MRALGDSIVRIGKGVLDVSRRNTCPAEKGGDMARTSDGCRSQAKLFDGDGDGNDGEDCAGSSTSNESLRSVDGRPKRANANPKLFCEEVSGDAVHCNEQMTLVAVDSICPNPWQPRSHFDAADLSRLAESIVHNGLLQPVVVRNRTVPRGDTIANGYEIVVGERRWQAYKMLGRAEIPAIIRDVSDNEMPLQALSENLERADLSDYEVSLSISRAEKEFPHRSGFAKRIGISRTDLYRYLAFQNLPEFIVKDLRVQPMLLGKKSAEAVVSKLAEYGDDALRRLPALWERVKTGHLPQAKLAAALSAAVMRSPQDGLERIRKALFIAESRIGSIVVSEALLEIRIKRSAITDPKIEKIVRSVEDAFP